MKHEHFWVMCAAASTALVLIVGAAGAAVAQPPSSRVTIIGERPEESARSVRVSYRDLNLASAQGEKILNRRVGGAARYVCEPHFSTMDRVGCESFAWRGARPQIALAVQRAREMAMTGNSSIPLVAIAINAR